MHFSRFIESKLKLNPEACGHAIDRQMLKQGGFGTAGASPSFPTPF
jgi:hypothetical protein